MFIADLDAIYAELDEEMAVPEDADIIKALIRPALGFVENRFGDQPSSASYLDGLPNLSTDTAWPQTPSGQPLTLVASINVQELPSIDDWPTQPTSGVLLFFASNEDEADRSGSVIYEPRNSLPSRTSGVPSAQTKPARPLTLLEPGWSPPINPPSTFGPDEIPFELEDEVPLFDDLSRNVDCQLFGIPDIVQENPLPPYVEPQSPYRLLAQIEGAAGFVLYFIITHDDLAAGLYQNALFSSVVD